jgi:hypothetical protein
VGGGGDDEGAEAVVTEVGLGLGLWGEEDREMPVSMIEMSTQCDNGEFSCTVVG